MGRRNQTTQTWFVQNHKPTVLSRIWKPPNSLASQGTVKLPRGTIVSHEFCGDFVSLGSCCQSSRSVTCQHPKVWQILKVAFLLPEARKDFPIIIFTPQIGRADVVWPGGLHDVVVKYDCGLDSLHSILILLKNRWPQNSKAACQYAKCIFNNSAGSAEAENE